MNYPTTAGMCYATIFGIDSHKRTTTICALDTGTGSVEKRTFPDNDYGKMAEFMKGFDTPAWGVYEAGCTGFVPARKLSRPGVAVTPIAPSKTPSSDQTRNQKNDKNDSVMLARNAMSGNLTIVWVPSEEAGGLREVCHTLEDLKDARKAAEQRVDALLGRHGVVWSEKTRTGRPKKQWGRDYRSWLHGIDLGDDASNAALEAATRCAESAREQYEEAERKAREVAASSSLRSVIMALMCLKCVQFKAALAFAAEVGDFLRFSSGRKVTAYLGLAPREGSSADSRSLGAITKSGSPMVRRILVECSWAATRCGSAFKKCPEGVDPRVVERARSLSARLSAHRRSMLARGKNACKANAATAAELARFMLFLGREAQALADDAEAA